jgi:hypothetical protein
MPPDDRYGSGILTMNYSSCQPTASMTHKNAWMKRHAEACFENSVGGEFFNYASNKSLYPCFDCLIKKGLDFFHFGPGRTYRNFDF